jgi:2-polyprenyl-6-hydroxyphenyl methylase/3-demethylubiquinone-9 3-methyltransferase
MSTQHAAEVYSGERFEFGRNWTRFLRCLDEERVAAAEKSLLEALEVPTLRGRTFLDAGCGSGLFSLAARRLGALVHSFDYDPHSVNCARELKRRYFAGDPEWSIEEGSVLDAAYLRSLGRFDVVYSWGVLHHTGDMWQAMESVLPLVAGGGSLFIALYNDQGTASLRWKRVKRLYNRLPRALRFLVIVPSFWVLNWRSLVKDALRGDPLRSIRRYSGRGMSFRQDLIDWVGGYPFEVATPEQVFDFCKARGFTLTHLRTCGGSLGCNEFVFRRVNCQVAEKEPAADQRR